MIVTCPSCSANYRIKADIINMQKGRVVRCSACGNSWRVFPPKPSEESPPSFPEHIKLASQSTSHNKTLEESTEKSQKDFSEIQKKSSVISWLLAILCFNLIILSFFYLFRKDIVKILPQTERFYQIIGTDVTVTGISLVMPYLEKINHSDGHVSLLIQGSFLNSHAKDTLKIPPLKITLLNNSNLPVTSFTKSDFNPTSLLPGGRSDFTYEVQNLPKEAVDVRIEFEQKPNNNQ